MHTLDLSTYPDLHPAAALALGSIGFGRGNLNRLLGKLNDDQLLVKPENFNNDIATLVTHIAATEVSISHLLQGKPVPEEIAVDFLLDQPPSPLPQPQEATVAQLQHKLETSLQQVETAFQGLTEEDMGRIIPFGPELQASVRWLVALLPTHQFLHLGQIQMLINNL